MIERLALLASVELGDHYVVASRFEAIARALPPGRGDRAIDQQRAATVRRDGADRLAEPAIAPGSMVTS